MFDWLTRLARTLALLSAVLAVACVAGAQAVAPAVHLTVTPASPYVDDNVSVSFTVPRAVPADSEINVVVLGTGACSASLAAKTVKGPQSAGRRFSLRFRPADQVVGRSVEWCQGKAKIRVTEAKNESFVRKLAEKAIRFRDKP